MSASICCILASPPFARLACAWLLASARLPPRALEPCSEITSLASDGDGATLCSDNVWSRPGDSAASWFASESKYELIVSISPPGTTSGPTALPNNQGKCQTRSAKLRRQAENDKLTQLHTKNSAVHAHTWTHTNPKKTACRQHADIPTHRHSYVIMYVSQIDLQTNWPKKIHLSTPTIHVHKYMHTYYELSYIHTWINEYIHPHTQYMYKYMHTYVLQIDLQTNLHQHRNLSTFPIRAYKCMHM